jgi:hypothetical protein
MQDEFEDEYPEYPEDEYDEPISNSEHFNAYDYEEESEESGTSFSYHKTNRKYRANTKSTDKAFHTVMRRINRETVPISYYKTGFTPGTVIRDAITGIYDPSCRVGKRDEFLYYKVCMATGEGPRGKYGEAEPHHLYYDNPEAYERHFCTTVDESIKNRWRETLRREIAYRESLSDERERQTSVQIK